MKNGFFERRGTTESLIGHGVEERDAEDKNLRQTPGASGHFDTSPRERGFEDASLHK